MFCQYFNAVFDCKENLRVTDITVPVHLRYHKPSFVPLASQNNMINIEKPNQQHPVAIVRMQVLRLPFREVFVTWKDPSRLLF